MSSLRQNAPPVRRTHLVPVAALSFGILAAVWLYTGNGYGFHQDELQFLDDARHLHWGFAAYPPATSFLGRISIALFGISPRIFRLPAMLVNATSLVLAGLLARELGGGRTAQLFAVLAGLPVALAFSSVLQYNTPDYFSWALLALFTARVLRSGDARNWLGAGAGLGLGALSKYSIAFAAVSLVAGLIALPSQRHHLQDKWFWRGALLTLLIASPNLAWLATHHFLTLRMESYIHVRDIRLGRTSSYFADQLKYSLLQLPILIAGFVLLLRSTRFRLLAFFWVGPFVLFALARGRGYYLLPGYFVLNAAGPVALLQWSASRRHAWRVAIVTAAVTLPLAEAAIIGALFLPIFRPASAAFAWQMRHNDDMPREIGWPEFAAQVAAVRDSLPPQDLPRLAILADNFGDAGALALYGPRYGLPTPISTVNSFHDRGFGPYIPDTFIITGSSLRSEHSFASCFIAARIHEPWNVETEATDDHPQILVCRHLLQPLPALWAREQTFG